MLRATILHRAYLQTVDKILYSYNYGGSKRALPALVKLMHRIRERQR